jgi:hypothetical protein
VSTRLDEPQPVAGLGEFRAVFPAVAEAVAVMRAYRRVLGNGKHCRRCDLGRMGADQDSGAWAAAPDPVFLAS